MAFAEHAAGVSGTGHGFPEVCENFSNGPEVTGAEAPRLRASGPALLPGAPAGTK